jgi:hypothetical protein
MDLHVLVLSVTGECNDMMSKPLMSAFRAMQRRRFGPCSKARSPCSNVGKAQVGRCFGDCG